MPYRLVTAPASSFLSLAAAKEHLAVEWSDDDAYIQTLIDAAISRLDGFYGVIGRALITQTWELTTDDLAGGSVVEIRLPPVASITTVQTMQQGVYSTWTSTNYTTRLTEYSMRLMPAFGKSWPLMDPDEQAIKITFTAGYGSSASSIPPAIVHAAKLLVGHYYSNREAIAESSLSELPIGVDRLIAPYKLPVI